MERCAMLFNLIEVGSAGGSDMGRKTRRGWTYREEKALLASLKDKIGQEWNRSGIGFNLNGDHKIECGDEQWEQIIKWPYWEDWKEIFGHDRANGKNAVDILEAINELDEHHNIGNMGVDGTDYHVNLESR
ncbi:hypothetical protein SASPL_135691 [Salvia splendens]|uniref:Myb/SANT-like domain-containing protein n=1 Tax=Salvia splendens TaxID=180675 RepID=A0A8X8ZGU9_SALSN|nr:hypothetical protein SASPL_135691 [Salvia splendens]